MSRSIGVTKLKDFCKELEEKMLGAEVGAYAGIGWLSIRSDMYAKLKKKYGVNISR